MKQAGWLFGAVLLVQQAAPAPLAVPVEPVTAIVEALRSHDVVAMGAGHGEERGYALGLSLVRDPRFVAAVNDIVIEEGSARYQDVADRFVRGERVSDESLSQVWRNTTQTGLGPDRPWTTFFYAVQSVNASLPRERQVRVLLGDPPIDWENVHTREDHRKWIDMRESFPAALITPRASRPASGVQSVAAAVVAPATPAPLRFRVTAAGQPLPTDAGMEPAGWFPISADYFRTLGVAVRRGREFTKRDSLASAQVALVNETLARRLWPGEDPIGREITIDFVNDRPRQVVGVVADVRETSNQFEFAPHVFVPEAQLPLTSRGWFGSLRITMTYLVRAATDPLPFVDRLRSAVAEVYRSQPIYSIRTMEEAMSEQLTAWRQYLMLLGTFAGIAAILTLVGVYGLVAYSVAQRTHEIGIRRALGASAGAVLRLILRQGLILTGEGVGVGVTASLAATRILEGLLWGVSDRSPHVRAPRRRPRGRSLAGLLCAGAPRLGHQPDRCSTR
jgi:hypothetical protein